MLVAALTLPLAVPSPLAAPAFLQSSSDAVVEAPTDAAARTARRLQADMASEYKLDVPGWFPYMLMDDDRNAAYRRAIVACIQQFARERGRQPRVLDLGAGTGLLTRYAALA